MDKNRHNDVDDAMLFRIAKEYYVFGMKEDVIARKENVSRPHISRLLKLAKQRGMIKVSVQLPNDAEIDRIAQRLRQMSGLSFLDVVYVPTRFKNDLKKTSLDIASEASEVIGEYLSGCHATGVGWGYTIYETAKQLAYADVAWGGDFTPLVGISSESSPYLQVNTITGNFAEKSYGHAKYVNLPIALDGAQQASRLEKEKLSTLERQWEHLDSAVIGLGAPYRQNDVFMISEAGEFYKTVLSRENAVGDILSTFFHEDGSIVNIPSEYRIVAMNLGNLHRIPKVLCLAGGHEKVLGIFTAIHARFFNGLITDSNTAIELLKLYDDEAGHEVPQQGRHHE